jgi:hypothetical protein
LKLSEYTAQDFGVNVPHEMTYLVRLANYAVVDFWAEERLF